MSAIRTTHKDHRWSCQQSGSPYPSCGDWGGRIRRVNSSEPLETLELDKWFRFCSPLGERRPLAIKQQDRIAESEWSLLALFTKNSHRAPEPEQDWLLDIRSVNSRAKFASGSSTSPCSCQEAGTSVSTVCVSHLEAT